MPAITLKNLPENLHAQLKERARRHHRSLNGEVIAVLQEAVIPQASTPPPAHFTPPRRRPPLPTFGGSGRVPPDFDLNAVIREENAAADEALARRILHLPHDPA